MNAQSQSSDAEQVRKKRVWRREKKGIEEEKRHGRKEKDMGETKKKGVLKKKQHK